MLMWQRSIDMCTAMRLTVPLAKMISMDSVFPQPGISFGRGSLIREHILFIHWSLVTVNSACIMIRTHNEDMDCNDEWWMTAVTDFISTPPYVLVVKMYRMSWLEKADSVCVCVCVCVCVRISIWVGSKTWQMTHTVGSSSSRGDRALVPTGTSIAINRKQPADMPGAVFLKKENWTPCIRFSQLCVCPGGHRWYCGVWNSPVGSYYWQSV